VACEHQLVRLLAARESSASSIGAGVRELEREPLLERVGSAAVVGCDTAQRIGEREQPERRRHARQHVDCPDEAGGLRRLPGPCAGVARTAAALTLRRSPKC